ncbi:plant lipid transfer protein/Par allergen [Artemisia annua]|uniref:Plant lipid transfer protein/Par allergen n=1 Tax=Artemisia annua TaxID=35608 RepID=A0A2U1QAQ2_ARTAN|nr:plant lipid transfer protein/Par allergen [Artemisia annua]
MPSNRYEVFSIALVMVTLCGGAMVTTGCTIAIVSLSPCISYVTGNVSTPSQPCCAQLANVVQSEPLCFCALFSSGHTWTSSKVNKTVAKGLPKACNVTTNPLSRCNGEAWWERGIPPSQSMPKKEGEVAESSLDAGSLRGHVMPMAPRPMSGIVKCGL